MQHNFGRIVLSHAAMLWSVVQGWIPSTAIQRGAGEVRNCRQLQTILFNAVEEIGNESIQQV
jgi:hypothetical protein